MSQILQENLKVLEKFQPQVFKKVTGYIKGEYHPVNQQIERILLAKEEELIFNLLVVAGEKKLAICDHEDPIGEAYGWIDRFIDPSNKADIVFGTGFGYHLEVLITGFPGKKVIVIEPNMALFYQLMQVRNLSTILEKAEIFLDEPMDRILDRLHILLWDTREGGIQCQPFYVYAELFGDIWDELRYKFIKQVENFTVDIATRRYFGELWVHNNITNARLLPEASSAHGLIGKFQGVPGILISSGPSLNKNIHLLKGLEKQCVTMAAGTAIRVLEKNGIEPHFMVGIDASKEEGEMHKNLHNHAPYFVYSNQVAAGSVEGYPGPKFLMNYPIDLYTADFFRFAGILSDPFRSGPSVANTCFDLLFKMGCNPIILVGQDLAYSFESFDAGDDPGSLFKNNPDIEKEGYIVTTDVHGRKVYTQTKFIAMRNWFEGYFEKVQEQVEIINATEGGLPIAFTQNRTLKDVLEGLPDREINIGHTIKEVFRDNLFSKECMLKLNQYNQWVAEAIEALEGEAKAQRRLIDLIRRDISHPSKNKKEFDRTVDKINQLTDRVMKSSIYNSILKNLIEIDFYLVKLEVDRKTNGLSRYEDVKEIYVDAMLRQNQTLVDKLSKVKELLK